VELPGEQRILSLAEVQVFSKGKNIAPNGKADQSSTDFNGPASRAIDDNTNGDFGANSTTHTKTEDNPWWEVDLGADHPIDEIVVWNRTDGGVGTRLNNFKVIALDASRKVINETKIAEAPAPSAQVSLAGGQPVRLQNASADFSADGLEAAKAIDSDVKTGWSAGNQPGKAHVAIFEVAGKAGGKNDDVLVFTLEQKAGKSSTIGRFRLSVTSAKTPVRAIPEKIAGILARESGGRTDAEKSAVVEYYREIAPSLEKSRKQLAKLKTDLANIKPVAVPVMRELPKDRQRVSHVLAKGNFLSPGDVVDADFPKSFNAAPAELPRNRLGVARWLLSRDNPLTARVTVNRFWGQLFGLGIVETEEDFGTQGQLPSHQDLLDWLAVSFESPKSEGKDQANLGLGWDVKALLKTVVLSATYEQSSHVTPEIMKLDPRNRLLSHYPRRRLDAETVRDQALALSGLLSRKIGGPSVYPPQPDGLWRAAFNGQRTWETSKGDDRYRRGLYTFWRRTVPYPSMSTFDAPSRENCTMRRLPTNTPLQAFVTMNDPAFVEMAQGLGRRIALEGGTGTPERVRYGLKLVLARAPNEEQVQALMALYEKELMNYRSDAEAAKKLATEPLGALPREMDAAEQAAWTVVANVLLNLDGVLTKG
jgi:hypothetical protein